MTSAIHTAALMMMILFTIGVIGQPAKVRFRAFPSEVFDGRVTFILHELDPATRTAKVRIEIDNPEQRIKHEMYADEEISTKIGDELRVAVPNSAVMPAPTLPKNPPAAAVLPWDR